MASYRRVLDAKFLAEDFGHGGEVCRKAVEIFYKKLENPRSTKTKAMFEEWVKEISQAYPISGKALRDIAEAYGLSIPNIDGAKFFYAIQTYCALIVKLIAIEVGAMFYDSVVSERLGPLKEAAWNSEKLRGEMELLEKGIVYTDHGIKNFLEGEPLSWYIEECDQSIYEGGSKGYRREAK